jgi:hypothetical protein
LLKRLNPIRKTEIQIKACEDSRGETEPNSYNSAEFIKTGITSW